MPKKQTVTINFEAIAAYLNRLTVPAATIDPKIDKMARLQATDAFLNSEPATNTSPIAQAVQLQIKLLATLFSRQGSQTKFLGKGKYQETIDGVTYTIKIPYDVACRPSRKPNEQRWEVLENKTLGKGFFGTVRKSLWVLKATSASITGHQNVRITDVKASHSVVKIANDPALENELHFEFQNTAAITNGKAHLSFIQPNRKSDQSAVALFSKYIKGQELSPEVVSELSFDERVLLAFSFLENLAALHRIGRIHGDLKPENALFNTATFSGQLIDFAFTLHKDNPDITQLAKGIHWVGVPIQPNENHQVTYRKLRSTTCFDSFAAGGMLGIIFGCQDVLAARNEFRASEDMEHFRQTPLVLHDMFSTIPNHKTIPAEQKKTIRSLPHKQYD